MKPKLHRHLGMEYLLGLESEAVIDKEFGHLFPVSRPIKDDHLIVPLDDYYKVLNTYNPEN